MHWRHRRTFWRRFDVLRHVRNVTVARRAKRGSPNNHEAQAEPLRTGTRAGSGSRMEAEGETELQVACATAT